MAESACRCWVSTSYLSEMIVGLVSRRLTRLDQCNKCDKFHPPLLFSCRLSELGIDPSLKRSNGDFAFGNIFACIRSAGSRELIALPGPSSRLKLSIYTESDMKDWTKQEVNLCESLDQTLMIWHCH